MHINLLEVQQFLMHAFKIEIVLKLVNSSV